MYATANKKMLNMLILNILKEYSDVDHRLTQKHIKDFKNGFQLPKHMAEHIYMYSGASVQVRFLAPDSIMNKLIDWFGKDFRIKKTSVEGQIEITILCNEEAMFYWALQYGLYVEVIQPESLRYRITEAITKMNEKYGGEA